MLYGSGKLAVSSCWSPSVGGHFFQGIDPAAADAVRRTALSPAPPGRRWPAGRDSAFAQNVFFHSPLPHILSCGLMRIATSRNCRGTGTRASTPPCTSLAGAGSQTYMQRPQLTHRLFVQSLAPGAHGSRGSRRTLRPGTPRRKAPFWMPMALIFRDIRYIGVEARIVVTS